MRKQRKRLAPDHELAQFAAAFGIQDRVILLNLSDARMSENIWSNDASCPICQASALATSCIDAEHRDRLAD
jgi:hypothetical protein